MKCRRGKKSTAALLMALVMLMTGVFSGCAATNAGSSSGDGSGATPESAGSTAAPTEQVLRVARTYDASTKSMDPGRWSGGDDMMAGPSVYETLLEYDEDKQPAGRLAESYEVSDDQLSYTFHLRKGVQFHHGYGEMTSEDIKFTIERLAQPELNASSNYTNIAYENIAGIETPDQYTVVIKLKAPDVFFPDKMCDNYAYVVSKKAVEELGLDGFSKLGIGTGPFEFVEGGTVGEKYEVQRFADYWGDKAKLDKITFLTIPDDTTLQNAFEAGEVDMFDCSDVDALLKYKENDKYEVIDSPEKMLLYIGLNEQVEPLNNPKVREAIFHAFDRDMMVNDYFKGLEKKATGILPTFSKFSIQDEWNPEYSVDKAKALLAEAGYPNGFSIDYYTVNDTLSLGPGTLIEYFLTQIGIDVNFQAVELGVFKEKVMAGKVPIWSSWNSTKIIPDSTLVNYTSASYPGMNWIGLKDPAYDKAIESAFAEADLTKREEYYKEAQKILMDSNTLYAANTYTSHTCLQSYVHGFARNGLLRKTFEDMYIGG